jgi:hypothetical protein
VVAGGAAAAPSSGGHHPPAGFHSDQAGQPPELAPDGPWQAIAGPWVVEHQTSQDVPLDGLSGLDGLGDWTAVRSLERFSGTLRYRATVTLDGQAPAETALPASAGAKQPEGVPAAAGGMQMVEVDLGQVGEAAEVFVNGVRAGAALWAPYRIFTAASLWQPGPNELLVQVTNSAANAYEGALRPSGLRGPVRLRSVRTVGPVSF